MNTVSVGNDVGTKVPATNWLCVEERHGCNPYKYFFEGYGSFGL